MSVLEDWYSATASKCRRDETRSGRFCQRRHARHRRYPKATPGWANGSEVSGCLATAHWAGYPVYDNSTDQTATFVEIFSQYAGRDLDDGTPTVLRPLPGLAAGGTGRTTTPRRSAETCAAACAASSSCVAWDFGNATCAVYDGFSNFDEVDGSVAAFKGLVRAGVSAAIYTGTVDIETECDGFRTYDRRHLKYDPSKVRAAAAALRAATTDVS